MIFYEPKGKGMSGRREGRTMARTVSLDPSFIMFIAATVLAVAFALFGAAPPAQAACPMMEPDESGNRFTGTDTEMSNCLIAGDCRIDGELVQLNLTSGSAIATPGQNTISVSITTTNNQWGCTWVQYFLSHLQSINAPLRFRLKVVDEDFEEILLDEQNLTPSFVSTITHNVTIPMNISVPTTYMLEYSLLCPGPQEYTSALFVLATPDTLSQTQKDEIQRVRSKGSGMYVEHIKDSKETGETLKSLGVPEAMLLNDAEKKFTGGEVPYSRNLTKGRGLGSPAVPSAQSYMSDGKSLVRVALTRGRNVYANGSTIGFDGPQNLGMKKQNGTEVSLGGVPNASFTESWGSWTLGDEADSRPLQVAGDAVEQTLSVGQDYIVAAIPLRSDVEVYTPPQPGSLTPDVIKGPTVKKVKVTAP